MTKLKLVRAAVAASSAIVLSLGVVGMASASQSWDDGGDGNSIESKVKNDNDVNVHNSNKQTAKTGSAEVERNDMGGSATSGSASNANATTLNATVTNSGHAAPALPDDNQNTFSVDMHVSNDNDVVIKNKNDQKATSGNASVEHNGTGGSATSGNASNTNTTTVGVTVTN